MSSSRPGFATLIIQRPLFLKPSPLQKRIAAEYRQRATFHTDGWKEYGGAIFDYLFVVERNNRSHRARGDLKLWSARMPIYDALQPTILKHPVIQVLHLKDSDKGG